MPRRLRPKSEIIDEKQPGNHNLSELDTSQKVVAYYRQSHFSQLGNTSTEIQTEDMIELLKEKGFDEDQIELIDEDAGLSGQLRIDERSGMRSTYEKIQNREIGTVACVDEDRLFRDETQIQVNVFIDACKKSNVKVFTPSVIYDFNHPDMGNFFVMVFRQKCEAAAQYLGYMKEKMIKPKFEKFGKRGLWFGARMPIGYMVDNRKKLHGEDNPMFRKFQPFEPYAEMVRVRYRYVIEAGLRLREAKRRIHDEGLAFPEASPPRNFKTNYQLKNRGEGYYFTYSNFKKMLTNPVYLGHWKLWGAIWIWDNHEPIVDLDTFMTIFNSISKVGLDGYENEDYKPRFKRAMPVNAEDRDAPQPLLEGLIGSYVDGDRLTASRLYTKHTKSYMYILRRQELHGTEREWERRAKWIDEIVVFHFRKKLRATYKSEIWEEALDDAENDLQSDIRIKKKQLQKHQDKKDELVSNLEQLQVPSVVSIIEKRLERVLSEIDKIEADIHKLEASRKEKISVKDMKKYFEEALDNWENMSRQQRSAIIGAFVEQVDATDYNRSGDMTLHIRYADSSSEEVRVWHCPKSDLWSYENSLHLQAMVKEGASQLEIAKEYPTVMWYQIYNEIKKHFGKISFPLIYLGKQETYEEYIADGARKPRQAYWRDDDDKVLKQLIENQANQEEIMKSFPHRNWKGIRRRIRKLLGNGVEIEHSGIDEYSSYNQVEGDKVNSDSDSNSETVADYFLSPLSHAPGFPAPQNPAAPQS